MATNSRETGARKLVPHENDRAHDEISQDAAGNTPPANGMGLTEPVDRRVGRQPTPSPSPEKTSGAGPAIAEHSKDAKAPRGGRQPGAYIKK